MIRVEQVMQPDQLADFIDLPPKIYGDYPEFEAPLRVDRRLLLDPKHSVFWKRGEASYWVVKIRGRTVGRISAQIDRAPPGHLPAGTGMFGCLDCIDNRAAVAALTAAAERWLTERKCRTMFGPCALDMNNEPGLLIEGFDRPAMTLSPWHPPYLASHLAALGYEKLRDLHNWRLDLDETADLLPERRRRLAERMPELVVRHPTGKSFPADIKAMCDVYNDGWSDHWGFIPLTPADLVGLDQLMKWLVPRDAFKIVELAGRPVATLLLIPNLFELTAGLGPRPGIAGWARLLWRALTHRFRSGRIIIFGIAKDLQGTVAGSAIAALLIDEMIAGQAKLKGQWVEAGWVLENNQSLISILERFQFRRSKTFRLYGKGLPAGFDPALAG